MYGVLDDADGDRRAVALARRLQFRQVGAVGQGFHRPQREARGGAPQDVRAGREEGAGGGPGQELAVCQDHHAGAEAAQQVRGQRLLGVGVAADRGAQQAAGPGLGRRHPPGLRERPVPGLVRRPPEERGVLRAVRHVRHRPVHRDDPQLAAEHPRRAVRRGRPGHPLEQHPHRIGAQLPPAPRQRGDVRQPPLAALARIDPSSRRQPPGQQVRAPPLAVQPVGQLGHHLPVPAVPAPEQPQGQDEIHHQPGRQQPAPLLPRPGHLDDLVDHLWRERPGQHPD